MSFFNNQKGICHTMASMHNSCRAFLAAVCALLTTSFVYASEPMTRLNSAVSAPLIGAKALGRTASSETINFAVTLPLRNQSDLDLLLHRLYDPKDSLYGHFLSSKDFQATYAPTQADYDTVRTYLVSQGFAIKTDHDSRMVITALGTASKIESAFAIELNSYQDANGRIFHQNSLAPALPASIAAKVWQIVGLDTSRLRTPQLKKAQPSLKALQAAISPQSTQASYLGPADIIKVYNVPHSTYTGAGISMALVELDGYTASNITNYISGYSSYFGKSYTPPLQIVSVDGYNEGITSDNGSNEVSLDIELALAIAPGLSNLYVYEAPLSSDTGWIDLFDQIAWDDAAQVISCSWGYSEYGVDSAALAAETLFFGKFAAQGQSFFATSGDQGAYDQWTGRSTATPVVSVDDPGSQAYTTSVGGTSLSIDSAGAYSSETTWWWGYYSTDNEYVGSGGGISTFALLPSWQDGIATTANGGSSTYRNVPDVALDSDPDTGYDIYSNEGWQEYGGTSAATPLWAGFTALVNQARIVNGAGVIGFINPVIYAIGNGSSYSTDFHDIADGSTNGVYKAVAGYDLTTGWGSFNGANLLTDMVNAANPYAVTLPSGWNLFTLPYNYGTASIASIFGSAQTLYLYNSALSSYNSLVPSVTQGVSYWVNLSSPITIDIPVSSGAYASSYNIRLQAGWNMIGCPYPYPANIAEFTFSVNNQSYSWATAVDGSLVYPKLWSWSNSANAYATVESGGVLATNTGYWIYAYTAGTLTITGS
jgi:kumamolisin